MHPYAIRLHPGQDIKIELDAYYFKNIMNIFISSDEGRKFLPKGQSNFENEIT